MKKYKIAVCIQSEVQFFSLRPLFEELKKIFKLEIVVDDYDGEYLGYEKMASEVEKLIRKAGFKPKTRKELSGEVFDVYLTAYIDKKVKAKCYLKYEYGTLNIKPSLTYIPEMLDGFHGFLCQSTVTSELLKVYGDTFPVENLRFYNKKRKKTSSRQSEKKRLLFAPTYNDQDDIKELEEIIKMLKTEYYVIIKGHHGTNYLKENLDKKCVLEKFADEYYDSKTSLSDLILSVDVCLFGNSSAIGEAMYVNVPCAIFAKDPDHFKLGEMHTTQYQLIEAGVLPWADDAGKILEVLKVALSKDCRQKQKGVADKLFPAYYKTGAKGYIDVINNFIEDGVASDYLILHDYVLNERRHAYEVMKRDYDTMSKDYEAIKRDYDNMREEHEKMKHDYKKITVKNKMLEDNKRELSSRLETAEAKIEDDSKKKLYKLADKIYKIEGRILNVKG